MLYLSFLLRSCEAWRWSQYFVGRQWRPTTYFEEHCWFAGQRKPSCEPPPLRLLCDTGNFFTINTRLFCKTCPLLQVWVVESSMEVVARQLLLLHLALMPQESMGNNGSLWLFCERINLMKVQLKNFYFCHIFLEKTEVFLEIFGNSEIRAQTEEMLRCAASNLSLSVTETLETPTHSCLNTTLLKVPSFVKRANLSVCVCITT